MTDTPSRRLRLSHLIIQPVLVWDDGTELLPGPDAAPKTVPLSAARALLDGLPAEIATLAAQLAE